MVKVVPMKRVTVELGEIPEGQLIAYRMTAVRGGVGPMVGFVSGAPVEVGPEEKPVELRSMVVRAG